MSPLQRQFDHMVADHGPAIDRLCAGYERDDARAEELRQEVWLGLWRALPSFRQDASLRTWMFRVAHNVAASHVRRRVRDRSTPSDQPGADRAPDSDRGPERQLSDAQRRRILREAIAQLGTLDRQLILLYLEDLPQGEIAQITGMSRANVSTRIGRIKERLTRITTKGSPR